MTLMFQGQNYKFFTIPLSRHNKNWSHELNLKDATLLATSFPRTFSLALRKNPGCGWSRGSQNLRACKNKGGELCRGPNVNKTRKNSKK